MSSATEQQTDVKQEVEVSTGDDTLKGLQCSLVDGRFSDAVVEFKDQRLQLHKVVLWGIPYFKSLLEVDCKDSSQYTLKIAVDDPLITGQVFADVVRTAYDHPVVLTHTNVKSILAAASLLQMKTLCGKCVQFCIKNLSLINVLDVTLFALSNNYMDIHRVLAECKNFLWVHAIDLKEQLWQLPVKLLCELLESDRLWAKSEYDRLTLIIAVFKSKLDKQGTQQGSLDCSECDCHLEHCLHKKTGACCGTKNCCCSRLQSECADNGGGSVLNALNGLLSSAVEYGSLSAKENSWAFTPFDALKLPDATRALAKGMIKAQMLQSLVQQGKSSGDPSEEDETEDLGWLRVGIEIDNAKTTLKTKEYWKSQPVFYSGCMWHLTLRFTENDGISVYCHCANADEPNLYRDFREVVKASVKFLCKDIRRWFYRRNYELGGVAAWGYHSYIPRNKVDKYITDTGSLRISFLVRRVFD